MAQINKGDIAEGILAAAMTARFLYKNRLVNIRHINAILNILKKNGLKNVNAPSKRKTDIKSNIVESRLELNSPNENRKILDKVECKIILNDSNMDALFNKEFRDSQMMEITNGAIAYVNESFVKQFSMDLYYNNVINNISIISSGAIEQKTTKTDINIFVDGIKVGFGISLKTSSAQFGQVYGADLRSMKELFVPLGVKFSPIIEEKMIFFAQKKQPVNVMKLAYNEAKKQLTELYKKDRLKFLKKLSEYIKYHATLKEDDVILLRIDKNKAKVYKFDYISEDIKKLDFQFKYSESSTSVIPTKMKASKKIPTLQIQNKSGQKFISIRSKPTYIERENLIKFKSYIESGALFDIFEKEIYSKGK